ncbi:hypothetical protein SLEP1_g3504 [Rubroshorea leprosula]|uniref:Uncharacterized protein n=1 Tax=Rubroshorea leprosula TaxID=152421 RepID=A0AAV5HUF2_9ROSI|nr:hypothetical protein SLEP1_g3504 [Rubroshorea leprosula]
MIVSIQVGEAKEMLLQMMVLVLLVYQLNGELITYF